MKFRLGWLIALGVLALLAFALATLPAGVASGPLGRLGLTAAGYTGSIWSGTATGLAWRNAPVGDVTWTLQPSRLFSGRLAGAARLARIDGSARTQFELGLFDRSLALAGTRFDLPLAALNALPIGMPKGWLGRASGQFDDIRVEQNWPVAVRGKLDLDGLVAPPPRNANVGSFHAVFPHPSPQPSLSVPPGEGNLTAQVGDKNGPFDVDAQLTVSRARNFALEGTLVPRGVVPPAMERSLQLLGPADASGRRQFSVGGTL